MTRFKTRTFGDRVERLQLTAADAPRHQSQSNATRVLCDHVIWPSEETQQHVGAWPCDAFTVLDFQGWLKASSTDE